MTLNGKFKQLRAVEGGINKNLFRICGGVTLVIMLMVSLEFFTRGAFPPVQISMFYLGVLIIYSFHKEIVRWLGKRTMERQGEYFVYSWVGLTTLLHVINFFAKDYFSFSAQGEPLVVLEEVSTLTLEVLGIFILTRCLKILRVLLSKPKSTSK